MNLSRIGLRWKLGGQVFINFLVTLAMAAAALFIIDAILWDQKKGRTQDVVDSAVAIINSYSEKAAQGKITEAEAKSQALAAIGAIRYDGDNYLWINDMQAAMVMHPIKPELNGKDMSGFADPAGKKLFVAFAEQVRKEGSGFVDYLWPKPGHSEPVGKISFVKGFKSWGWVIGTGVYVDDVAREFRKTAMVMGGLLVLGLLIGGGVSWFISQKIVKTAANLRKVLSDIDQSGDLSLRADVISRDEMGDAAQALNGFLNNLEPVLEEVEAVMKLVAANDLSQRVNAEAKSKLVSDIKESVNSSLESLSSLLHVIMVNIRQVANACMQTSQAIGQISDGAQGQLGAVKQIASGIVQTAKAIEDVSDNAKTSSEYARQSATMVAEGRENVTGMVRSVSAIAVSAREITKITQVIGQIAAQTNMLSLNAAIEAARAGEAGKGFAVVAEEVGKLAAHSGKSATDITSLLEKADSETRKGVEMAEIVGGSIEKISQGVEASDRMAGAIAVAMQQQSSAVDDIRKSVEELEKIGENNASASEEVTATMFELSRLADQTRSEVEKFRL